MIKKIIDAINDVKDIMISRLARMEQKIDYEREHNNHLKYNIEKLSEALMCQTQQMNTLLNHHYENDKTLEAVVFVPYRGKPIIYKDGKLLTTDTMTRFTVDWSFDSRTEITVNNE